MARKLLGVGFRTVDFQTESVEHCGVQLVGNWSLPLVAHKDSYSFGPEAAPAPGPETTPEVPPTPSPDLEAQITRMHHEKAAIERRVVALESQLRIMADSRWLKLGRRLGFGPKVE